MIQEILKWIIYLAISLIFIYLMARVFMKGILQELDFYLGKKFLNYLNKNRKKDEEKQK